MKKYDNFVKCLDVLQKADREQAHKDDIYRTGVIGQFNLVFELAWKALQQVLRENGVQGAENGSPREMLKLGYKYGMLDDEAVWRDMLKKRNLSVHIYDEENADEIIDLIFDTYITGFYNLKNKLSVKISELDGN